MAVSQLSYGGVRFRERDYQNHFRVLSYEPMSVDYHVIPWLTTWRVKRRGASRATTVHSTRGEAIEKARELAKKNTCGTVIVHRIDGSVSRVTTYGKDPYNQHEHSRTKK